MNKPHDAASLGQADDWSRHWDEYAESARQNPAQAYRRQLIFSLLRLPEGGRGVRLLDIGSGQGDMAAEIRNRYPDAEILGLELSRSGVELSHRKVNDARFVERNLLEPSDLPLDQRTWATHAICSEVIEHVDDPRLLLSNARPYMAPGCKLVVTAPGGPMSAFDKHIGHRKHFNPVDIQGLLTSAGYSRISATGAGFPFFNLYRQVVIMRGAKLIDDASAEGGQSTPWAARTAMSLFHFLFKFNRPSSPKGWQMVATAEHR